MALPRVACLAVGVLGTDQPKIDWGVRGLVGLGPGLTPSGDDLLGGMMIALMATAGGRAPAANCLRRSILRHAGDGTTLISAALLAEAAAGAGSDGVHRLLGSLLQARDTPSPLGHALDVAAVGHTSGWDCLAGLVLGIHLGLLLKTPEADPEDSLVSQGGLPVRC
jgi:hypothetical protein